MQSLLICHYREAWITRSEKGRIATNENYFIAERSRDLQPGSSTEATLLLALTQQAARTAFAKYSRTAKDFLFEGGRFSSCPSAIGSHFQL